jgi:hypothetical protein
MCIVLRLFVLQKKHGVFFIKQSDVILKVTWLVVNCITNTRSN